MDEIEVDGVLRDLSHLHPMNVVLAGKGKEGAYLRVRVHFGLHTVSRRPERSETADMQDENGHGRVFCNDRYAYSLGLPEILRRMIEEKYFCWESRDRNRAIHYAIVDFAPGRITRMPKGAQQFVYFYLYPGAGEGAGVHLHVTSCYMKDERTQQKRRFDTHFVLRKCLFSGERCP